jgi:hypothetical protein
MRRFTTVWAQLAVLAPAALASAAHAKPFDCSSPDRPKEDDDARWRSIVTPRLEETEYVPHLGTGSFGTMTSVGLTLTEQAPKQCVTINLTAFRGVGETTYLADLYFPQGSQISSALPNEPITVLSTMGYHVERTDVALNVGYRPVDGNVTLFAGVRYFELQVQEAARDVALTSNYEDRLPFLEIGARIAGTFAPGSPHLMYAQISGGPGPGSYEEHTTSFAPISFNGVGAAGEVALGYTYKPSDGFQAGMRLRLALFDIDLQHNSRAQNELGEYIGGTAGPEINVTYIF